MMILKIVENGGFHLIEGVVSCRFSRAPAPHVVVERGAGPEKIDLKGDAFVLNPDGHTIEKFFIQPRQEGRQA